MGASTASTAVASAPLATGRARRIAFAVACVLLFALGAMNFVPFAFVPLVTEVGSVHWFHELVFAVFGVLYLGGLLMQLRSPERRAGALVAVLAFPVLVAAIGAAAGFVVPPLVAMLVLAVAAAILHPGSRELFGRVERRSPPAFVLAVLWLVPGIVYAVGQFRLQSGAPAHDEHAEFGHWVAMAAVAVALPLLAAASGLRPPGWRFLGYGAGGGALALGLGSIAYPGLPSSFGTGWGTAAAVWGLAVLGLTSVGTDRGGLRTRTSVVIGRPVDDVFAYVADPRNDPEWCANVVGVEQRTGDGPALGAEYVEVHKPTGKEAELAIRIDAFEPPTYWLTVQEDEAGSFEVAYELAPAAGGGTRLTQVNDMRFERAWWLLSPVFWVAIKLTHPKQFAALKEVLEAVEEQAGRV